MSCLCDCCCTCVAVFVAVMWALLKFRVLPVPLMKVWFGLTTIFFICMTGMGCFFIDLLRFAGLPRLTTQKLCLRWLNWMFFAIIVLNPQIRIHIADEDKKRWAAIPPRSAVIMNHTSFWDTIQFAGLAPWSYFNGCRTLMKDSLHKLPIFGGICKRIGHFPVYFKSDEDGNFSVDKERQAVVMERVAKHIQQNGGIGLFPEGAVNKEPRTLKMFRQGSFQVVLDHKLPLYYFVAVGNDDTWHSKAPIGGKPADIWIKIGEYKIDHNKAPEAREIAAGSQEMMQKVVDELFQKRDAKRGKKSQ